MKKASAAQGKFMGSKAPYGYLKSPTNKHQLVIDPESAAIIKRIFIEYCNGESGRSIATRLNIESIENPRAYHYRLIGQINPLQDETMAWGSNTIMHLLRNQVYIGHMVQGKREVVSFKTKRCQKIPRDEWIIVENTHEPIINMDIWERVQKRIESAQKSKSHNPIRTTNMDEISLFSGIIRCSDCGSPMHFTQRTYQGKQRPTYRCGRYVNYGKEQCSTHAINFNMLKEIVMADIKQYAKLAEKDEEMLIKRLMASTAQERNRERNLQQAKMRELKKRLTTVNTAIKVLFKEKLVGNISDSIFKNLMNGYDSEQVQLAEEIEELEKKLDRADSDESSVTKWIKLIKDCIQLDELDRATAVTLIDCIEVSEHFIENGQRQQNITIKYNFVGNIPANHTEMSLTA